MKETREPSYWAVSVRLDNNNDAVGVKTAIPVQIPDRINLPLLIQTFPME